MSLSEAATIKAKARGLLRGIKDLLADKAVPKDVHNSLDALRIALNTNWADLESAAGEDTPEETAQDDNPEAKPEGAKEAATPDVTEGVLLESDVTPLIEKGAIRSDGTFTAKIITPGWGSSGYYSKAVIERDAPKAFPSGTKMFWNHPGKAEERDRPERDLNDLAAVTLTPATWRDNGPSGPGAYAEAKAFSDYSAKIKEKAPYTGLSIRGTGATRVGEAEGKKGTIIEKIVAGYSVDFVTAAGRGGQVALGESATPNNTTEEVKEMTAEEAKKLQESYDAMAAQNTRLMAAMAVRDAKDLANGLLAKAKGLPTIAKERLLERLTIPESVPMTKDGVLDRDAYTKTVSEAITAESSYVSGLVGSGSITGMGSSILEAETDETKLTSGLEDIFKRLGLSESAAKRAANR